MPFSSDEGKQTIRTWIDELQPSNVLDVGAGAGKYGLMLREIVPNVRTTALEVFVPYVSEYALASIYDSVMIGDARDMWEGFTDSRGEKFDLIIFGDVLEHMTKDEAVRVWDVACLNATNVIASLPIVEYVQGACFGNEHEAHLHTWSDEEFQRDMHGVRASWCGPQIGVYLA